ncbi:uncharacterized protein E0L32_008442 [Thyridium curvatum]|uniref:Uncharacterized protein n=1 Tax=Thyridium curvatum TaxID=1093900 RepID=A0A507AV15_9PEZI|nr:uncharacterized protein E0L32_008442 [Thyridium curvatum]TPX10556.1 hypothetical protein E0L32_008442 [Thyridium curvatum]
MNGVGTRQVYGYEPEDYAPLPAIEPSGRHMVEGYRQEVMDGFQGDKPLYNPLNPERPQSSALVDLKDSVQVHLLTETALADSKEFEILSQEEIDHLKKQCVSLQQRIEQTRANLAIQSKYRDAAHSMAKLYSPRQSTNRHSLLGHLHSGSQDAKEAEAESQACERRCEELASELFRLEKRIMEPQRKILQHTAGILQLTHKASRKPVPPHQMNGIPGSPESLYTYSNGRNSMEPVIEDMQIDDRSLYFPIDQDRQRNAIEIPVKSPIRKETKELREEADRLRDEIGQLRASNDSANLELEALQRESSSQLRVITETEKRMAGLNQQLRDVIVKFNPAQNQGYANPPSGRSGSGELLSSHLRYLDEGLAAVQGFQAQASFGNASDRLANINLDLRNILRNANLPSPPDASQADMDQQLDWLQNSLRAIDYEVSNASSSASQKQDMDQVENVLTGLWEVIQSGFASIQKEKEDRREKRMQMGLPADDDDMSGDESVDTDGPYSIQAFSTKVRWLYTQTTKLKEQKSVLKRQIKQQRELNNKSDAEKDRELQQKADELVETQALLAKAEMDAVNAQEKLADALNNLESTREASSASEAKALQQAEEQLKERNAKIATLEKTSKDLQAQLAGVESDVASLTTQLDEVSEAKKSAEAEAEKLSTEAKAKDAELEDLNVQLVALKTEATIARAELEGAYGSRAQRAADVAALAKSSQNQELQGQVDKLRTELASTLKEFESLTKDTISAEREKLELEGKLDDALAARSSIESEAREVREKLEAEVARLKEELDGEKLKVPPPSPTGSSRAGATMLSEQFRATMKEERKKFQEELRTEQMARRKLEDEIRALKRAAGPGKSPLSPRS